MLDIWYFSWTFHWCIMDHNQHLLLGYLSYRSRLGRRSRRLTENLWIYINYIVLKGEDHFKSMLEDVAASGNALVCVGRYLFKWYILLLCLRCCWLFQPKHWFFETSRKHLVSPWKSMWVTWRDEPLNALATTILFCLSINSSSSIWWDLNILTLFFYPL